MTETEKSTIDESAPQVPYTTREEYFEYLESVKNDPHLSPQEASDIISGSVEPDESFEEYLDRQTP